MKALLTATGDLVYNIALQSHQRTLAIRIKLFGDEHEIIADTYSDFRGIQDAMHDYKAALQSHQRALSIRINLLEEELGSTAYSYSDLCGTQYKMHDYIAC